MSRPLRIVEDSSAVYQAVRFDPEEGFPLVIAGCNNRCGGIGHLFQGWYESIMLQKDGHLTEVCRQKGISDQRGLNPGASAFPIACCREFRLCDHKQVGGSAGKNFKKIMT